MGFRLLEIKAFKVWNFRNWYGKQEISPLIMAEPQLSQRVLLPSR